MRPGLLRIAIFAAGGAVWLPLSALGHGLEFLTAKLTFLPESVVQVEVTADYAGNPLVPDEAAARVAVENPLKVKVDDGWVALNALARPSFERHDDWSACAPPSLPPPPPEAEHALITATWRWQHPADSISFTVPKGNLHDVFLWQDPANENTDASKWMLLLAGDVTKPLPLLPRARGWRMGAGVLAALLIAAGLAWLWQRPGRAI